MACSAFIRVVTRAYAATAAALSAALCAGSRLLGIPDALGWSLAALAGFALRGAAMGWGLALPGYRTVREPT